MSTSSNRIIQTLSPRFRSKMCYSRMRAAVRISKSEKNPRKLYYECPKDKDKGKYKFWDWCNLIGYDESNSDVEARLKLGSNDDARLGLIETHVANLKHIVNIIVFFCGLALVVSVIALVVLWSCFACLDFWNYVMTYG